MPLNLPLVHMGSNRCSIIYRGKKSFKQIVEHFSLLHANYTLKKKEPQQNKYEREN